MNRHDWLKALGLLGLGATGVGLAGIGPLAALGAGAKGATLAAGMAGPTTAGAGGLLGAGAALNGAMGAVGTAGRVMGATGLMGPSAPQQRPPMMPPPQPSGPMPLPGSSYSGGDMAPPGIDPNQWAVMTPEQKKALMAQRGMA